MELTNVPIILFNKKEAGARAARARAAVVKRLGRNDA